jgi:ankyrin repeat protein
MLSDLLIELAEETSGHTIDSSGVVNHGGAIVDRLLEEDAAAGAGGSGMPSNNRKCVIEKAPPIVLAALDGNITHLRHLLGSDEGENPLVHERDPNLDRTALCYAAQWGGFNGSHMASMLLDRKADVNGKPGQGVPLLVAAQGGHVELVRLLLERNAEATYTSPDTGDSSLLMAVKSGSIEVVNQILECGSGVHALFHKPNNADITPLYVACYHGFADIMALLLSHNVNARIVSKQRASALLVAAQQGHIGIVTELLRSTNVEINVAMHSGMSPLMAAAQRQSDDTQLVELLLRHGADPYQVDRRGRQAIHYAAAVGNIAIVDVLFQRQGSINVQTQAGATPLILAAQRADIALVSRLLELRAALDIEMNTPRGKTALFAATETGNSELVILLLKAGANRDITCNGSSPRDVARTYAYHSLALLFVDGPQEHWEPDAASTECACCSTPFSFLKRRV